MILLNKKVKYATQDSACFDIEANNDTPIVMGRFERAIIPTGLFITNFLPYWKMEIYSRSGLAAKKGIIVANAPGVIDADYPDEIKVILINLGAESFTINKGDRIAQGAIMPVYKIDSSDTGGKRTGGLGSTGI